MGRGRVVVKRIENKMSRQVTFAKRRNGLMKKAYELSVLCDAQVALLLFSHSGRLYQFSSSPDVLKTIDRYRGHVCASVDAAVSPDEMQNNYEEYVKQKAAVEVLQQSQRNLLGEDLTPLSTYELNQLESQIDKSLKQIRSRKTQVLLNQLCDLKRKEQMLQDANSALKRKLQELGSEEADDPLRLSCQTCDDDHRSTPPPPQPQTQHLFFQPLQSAGFEGMDVNEQIFSSSALPPGNSSSCWRPPGTGWI